MFFSASKPIANTIEGYDPKAAFRPRQMPEDLAKIGGISHLSLCLKNSKRPPNPRSCSISRRHADCKWSVHVVREHFNPREMHLNILKLMLNQALRDNEDSGH